MTATLEFNAETHTYRQAGRVLPGVTEILRDEGIIDARFFTPESRERGHAVHEACRMYDDGDLDIGSLDPRIHGYLESWAKFREATGFVRVGEAERIVVSETWQYAGRMDLGGYFREPIAPGNHYLLDLKSGAPCKSHGPQLAAYQHAAGGGCVNRANVYLREDGKLAKLEEQTDPRDWDAFRAFLTARNWKANNGFRNRNRETR